MIGCTRGKCHRADMALSADFVHEATRDPRPAQPGDAKVSCAEKSRPGAGLSRWSPNQPRLQA